MHCTLSLELDSSSPPHLKNKRVVAQTDQCTPTHCTLGQLQHRQLHMYFISNYFVHWSYVGQNISQGHVLVCTCVCIIIVYECAMARLLQTGVVDMYLVYFGTVLFFWHRALRVHRWDGEIVTEKAIRNKLLLEIRNKLLLVEEKLGGRAALLCSPEEGGGGECDQL